jgi:hypothetical protein
MPYDDEDDLFSDDEFDFVDEDSSELEDETEEEEKPAKKPTKRAPRGKAAGKPAPPSRGAASRRSAPRKKAAPEPAPAEEEEEPVEETAAVEEPVDVEDEEQLEPVAAEPAGPPQDHVVHIYEHGELLRTIPRKFTDEEAVSFAEEYTRTGKSYGRYAVATNDDEEPSPTFSGASRG